MADDEVTRQQVKGLDMMLSGLHMLGVLTNAQYRDWSLELHDGNIDKVCVWMTDSIEKWTAQKKGKDHGK